jgi:hypothetical protein
MPVSMGKSGGGSMDGLPSGHPPVIFA